MTKYNEGRFWTLSQLTTFYCPWLYNIASGGSPPEQIPDLGKKMKNLTLGNSSVNKSGMANSTIIVHSNAGGAVNKSDTGLSRVLHAWLVNLSVTCLFIAFAIYKRFVT